MSEKKNIVIKVKYPSPGKVTEHHASGPPVVTEWNFKRVGLALGGVLLAMMTWFYATDSDDGKPSVASNTAHVVNAQQQVTTTESSGESVATAKQPAPTKPISPAKTSKVIARSQLTHDIKKNEPVDKLKLPLKIGKKETLWIYNFVEIKGMVGQPVYHEWWLNGNLVSRKKVNISDDPWRTASKQLITYTNNNDWIVRVVDEARNTLSETSFNLELK
ncbi:hypothetical protein MCAMS1_01291 [biofilm metagenome]